MDGFRVLTAGGDFKRFKQNPICLWMHRRYFDDRDPLPIGKWEHFEVKGDDILAVPTLDTKDDFAVKIANKVEQDIIRMCSIGIRVIEVSEDPKFLLPGQTRPTITKWELVEASLVDIGRHSEALRLYDDNYQPMEEEMSFAILPLFERNQSQNQNQKEMKLIALKLGLSEQATENEILSKIGELMSSKSASDVKAEEFKLQLQTAQTTLNGLKQAKIDDLINQAMSAGKISSAQKEHFMAFAASNFDAAKQVLDTMAATKPMNVIKPGGSSHSADNAETKTFSDLLKKGAEAVELFKAEQPEEYARLYREEYKIKL